jgi:signal transduction histidine kinase
MKLKTKISILTGSILFTVAIHYGWVLDPLFGDTHWVHALHGRFCYIPIVIGASWFGLRGGLISAAIITVFVVPYIFIYELSDHNYSSEFVEILFYFSIAILTGAIIDRELLLRKKHEKTELELERSKHLSMIGEMTASVAHEIKNPLASLKGAVEIINDTSTNENEKDEFKNIAISEIKRIDSTVKDFLLYSRPQKAKLTELNLSELIITSIKQLENQAVEENITFQTDIKSDLFIKGDREKLHQVLLNLILNSIQASPPHSEIIISAGKDCNNTITLSVKDFGDGIPSENIEKIFDPFFTTKSSGTGLGLAIVKSIVEELDGEIKITSSEQSGTKFTISFDKISGNNQ